MKNLTIAVLTTALLASSVLGANSALAKNGNGNGGGNRNGNGGGNNSGTTFGEQSTGDDFSGLQANSTCSNSHVTILGNNADDCSGYYEGNDKPTAALSVLNDAGNPLFGGLTGWSLAATDDAFNVGNDVTSGGWTLDNAFSGPATIAVKAGNSFSLYFFENLANFDAGTFNTAGVKPVGNGNTPGLSHLSLYITEGPVEQEKTEVPEPFAVLGLAFVGGIGATIKRRQQ